ncbi:NAD-dependent epimerase/dehydratase family protein [Halanaerobaculum tunisiense]
MSILVTGADGYVGWPTMLKLGKEYPNERIIGVDNFGRRRWLEEVGSVSALPVEDMETRIQAAKENGIDNLTFVEGDLTDKDFVNQILEVYEPRVVLHTAAQPSAPYSQINGERANFTQHNNNQSTRNLLWGLKELGLEDTHFVETTTTGTYGAPEFEIPEGLFEVEYKDGKDTIPFPGMAGSWYHMSKCNDVNNLWLANKQWGLSVTDIRTAIVYGTETEETNLDPRLNTRFDFDYYFGVVINRFCAMALAGYPITVYGKGEQRKPMVSLQDTVQSLVNAVELENDGEFKVYNQTLKPVSIIRLAKAVKNSADELGLETEIKHISNPREEKEDHKMKMANDRFMNELLNQKPVSVEEGVHEILTNLKEFQDVIVQYKDRFMS